MVRSTSGNIVSMIFKTSTGKEASLVGSHRALARCRHRRGRSNACWAPGRWAFAELRRVLQLVPTFRPWPLSVPVERCGGVGSRRPLRRCAALTRSTFIMTTTERSSQQVTQTKEWALLTGNGLVAVVLDATFTHVNVHKWKNPENDGLV